MPYLYVETARHGPCHDGRLPSGEPCKSTSAPTVLGLSHGRLSHTGEVRLVYPDESTDALIYISVVMVFYIAIILMLVLSNVRRCKDTELDPETGPPTTPKRHLVAQMDKSQQTGVKQKVIKAYPQCAACTPKDVVTV